MPAITVPSPLGPLSVFERDGAITALRWGPVEKQEASTLLDRAATQLDAYFYCELKAFDLPFAPNGSAFQRAVWDAMLHIPFGETLTYGDIARRLDDASPQAVGTACGANPIPILIPCHRIVAAGDKLGGYSGQGGLDTKRFLLELEGWPGVAQRDLFAPGPDMSGRPETPADG
jgi:methylated-DNA-[protein]-cysteine S-methyltransferase